MEKSVVVSVRMPERLRDRVNQRARADYRSLSQEIVWLVSYAIEALEREKAPESKDRNRGK